MLNRPNEKDLAFSLRNCSADWYLGATLTD